MHRLKLFPHYFSRHVNREVKEVYGHMIINSVALAMVFIFEPIYLFQLGYSLSSILWFYVMVYVWYLLLIFPGARFAGRFGYKHSILISNIFYVIYWLTLFQIKDVDVLFFVAPVFFALQKSWFWPAFDADVALFSGGSQRGREVGVLFALMQGAFIVGPLLGGAISEEFGFLALFISAGALLMCSVYPLFKSPEIRSRHAFRFRNFLKMFARHKSNFFGYWGFAEDMMVMSIWPVFMFMVIPDVLGVGVLVTIATLIATVLMLYIGRLTDRIGRRQLIRWTSLFYGLTWIFRFLGRGVPGVLIFDTLTRLGKNINQVPMQTLTFDRAGENKNPDEAIAYSVFFEVSLSVGKILTCLAGIAILALGLSVFWVFALAGVLTMFYGFLR